MNKRKWILWVAVICLLAMLLPGTVLAATGGWNQNADGSWSYYENGQQIKNTVYQINYKYYGFDSEGIMYADTWYKDPSGSWYYFSSDGSAYRSGAYFIDGAYYGFDGYGKMYADCAFGAYASPEPRSDYRAKGDGVLYRNEWYNDGGNWCYYGDDALKCMDMVLLIKGQYYGFDSNGNMYKSRVFSAYDKTSKRWITYCAKADGTLEKNAWRQDSGDWLYFGADGAAYCNGIYSINGAYYGFDHNSRMYNSNQWENFAFTFEGRYYRAKADGRLFRNEWYETEAGWWYYYGNDCAAGDDFVQVDGTWYFFRYGYIVTDGVVQSKNGTYYYIYNSGESYVTLPAKGWFYMDGAYYYHNGNGNLLKNQVMCIDGKYYGFDEAGRMYADGTFTISSASGWTRKYYRAKKDGSLYVNAWFADAQGDWYYFGADGAGVSDGWQTIGGAQYFFENSRMQVDTVIYDHGVQYALDKNGKQIKTPGKHAVGDDYVYVQADGTLYTDGWISISGKWYYFNPTMLANKLQVFDGVLYKIDNAGVCVAVTGNGIYDSGADSKVYLENGKVSEGWKLVDGNWYYFGPYMHTDGVRRIDGEYYVFDQTGKLFTGGWYLQGSGSLYNVHHQYIYANSAGKAVTGLQTIGGVRYLFSDYGTLYTDTTVKVNGVTYILDKSGKIIGDTNKDGWKAADGKYYYVKNGQLVTSTILEIEGKQYAFDANGVMCADGVYRAVYGVGGDTYVLAEPNGTIKTNGWNQYGGYWYYADRFGRLLNGEQVINGETYIFQDYRMMAGTFWWGDRIVTTDADGAVISRKDPADGWSYMDGVVNYYQNGKPFTGWVGDYLILDGYMSINTWDAWKDDYYALDVYGRYVKSGWHRFSYGDGEYSNYVYAKPGGKLCYNEWYAVNGVWYYFDGVYLLCDGVYEVEGELCRFADDGAYLGKVAVSGDGWKQVGDDWYYLHAGTPVTGVKWINGKQYVFDNNGVLSDGGFVYYLDPVHFVEYVFYTDNDGAIPGYTGWKKLNGNWCYFDSNGIPMLGWFQDNGKEYYSTLLANEDQSGFSIGIVSGYVCLEGELHYFDANGVHKGTKGIENGWFQADNAWYYFRNGTAVTDYQVIDGKGYYFVDGVMGTSIITEHGYFDSNGVQRRTAGWYETEIGWIYVQSDGTLANGVHMINGKEYYFFGYTMIR